MKLTTQSALDLPLRGSVGAFKVGAHSNQKTFEVKYLLTHVGLNFDVGNDEKLLKELAPVREIFDFRSLDFDQIMQRDIDDARVSGELIPYILDDRTKDLVKFFPPIVVIALPVEKDENTPSRYYPSVTTKDVERTNDPSGVTLWRETQSGPDGQEVFKFEQPILNGEPQLHDLVTLKINTSKCRLIIVDGQHRAMALLALYRNLKDDWSDSRRKPFQSYYKEWTPDHIRSFNLKDIMLPMIICTIPELDSNFAKSSVEYDLLKASRSIFLTLNKNARKVSRSRNLLLDDADLVSSFMRSLLSKIKNGDRDFANDHSMEIHNVELDQSGDRQVIVSPMAFTGVSHLYYIVEHILLDNGDVKGIGKRDGRFSTRKTGSFFENALNRLDAENLIGAASIERINRNIFTRNDEDVLAQSFLHRYGKSILRALSKFAPFDIFAQATQDTKHAMEAHGDVHLKPMLFDGQGIGRVFKEHKNSLKARIEDGFFKNDVPKIMSYLESLEATQRNYDSAVREFEVNLTCGYLSELPKSAYRNGNDVCSNALYWVQKLYNQVFSTVAFQAALVCGFYAEIEKISSDFAGDHMIDIEHTFEEYLSQQSEFFKPTSFSKLKRIISLLFGEATGNDSTSLEVLEKSRSSFRHVVHSGEMAPDEWPKYKYLMLELWTPTDDTLEEALENERVVCRLQVLESLIRTNLKEFCVDQNIKPTEVTEEQKNDVAIVSYQHYHDFLKIIGRSGRINQEMLDEALSKV